MAVGQEEQQQQQLPQAARPSTNVAVCVLREQPPPYKQRTGTTRLFSQLPTVGIELFVLLPAPGVEAWTRQPKHRKRNGATGSRCSFVLCVSASSPLSTLGFVLGGTCTEFSRVLGSYFQY